ncbi:DUF723 domain-containing protein [Vibrio cholerae]
MNKRDFNNLVSSKRDGESIRDFTIVGMIDEPIKEKYYVVKCDKCSQDPELFGEGLFKVTLSNLKKGSTPCGCSKNPQLTEEQYKTKASRFAASKGYTFLGWDGEFKGNKTRVKMECPIHGEFTVATYRDMMHKSVGCKGCKKETLSKLNNKGLEYYLPAIEQNLTRNNLTFVRVISYTHSHDSQIEVECPVHGKFIRSAHNLAYSGACSQCKSNGYRKEKGGNFYLFKWTEGGESFLKFGVTNYENVNKRIRQQKRSTDFTPQPVITAHFEDGSIPLKLESFVKQTFECGVVDSSLFNDGYTETIPFSVENVNIILSEVASYG